MDTPMTDREAARIIGAAVALHALLSSSNVIHDPVADDVLIERAFAIAEQFVARAEL